MLISQYICSALDPSCYTATQVALSPDSATS